MMQSTTGPLPLWQKHLLQDCKKKSLRKDKQQKMHRKTVSDSIPSLPSSEVFSFGQYTFALQVTFQVFAGTAAFLRTMPKARATENKTQATALRV